MGVLRLIICCTKCQMFYKSSSIFWTSVLHIDRPRQKVSRVGPFPWPLICGVVSRVQNGTFFRIKRLTIYNDQEQHEDGNRNPQP